MFSTRRLAKRSIVGSRVCAPWTDDRFYPGVIQSTQTWPNGEDVYTVIFDDNYQKVCQDTEIIGPGFQTISTLRLKSGQKVFLTHKGREISGVVIQHDPVKDEVLIDIRDEVELTRKLDELRLMESRKSARLQDQDTDYSRMVDFHPETPKKRTVSSVIDVPAAKLRCHRDSSSSPEDREEEAMLCEDEDYPETTTPEKSATRGVMNEHMAAMVLTALSCSPVSPGPYPTVLTEKASTSSSSGNGSSVGSSGVWGMKGDSNTPSPPQIHVSNSAPTDTVFSSRYPPDEGVQLDDEPYFPDDFSSRNKKSPMKKTAFKCIWPGCGKIQNTSSSIERHIRQSHLSPKDDSDESDHEEEFYYQEVEVTVDTVTQTFADMYTSSPPQISFLDSPTSAPPPISDHDYGKKSEPLNIPSSSRNDSRHPSQGFNFTSDPSSAPMSRSWQFSQGSYGGFKTSRSFDRLSQSAKSHSLSTSPKNSPMHKKTRSETKKCRKVYGMEHRDLWCTQCKWKKACTRFMD